MTPQTSRRSPEARHPRRRATLRWTMVLIAELGLILAVMAAHQQRWTDSLELLASPPLWILWLGLVSVHFTIEANRRDDSRQAGSPPDDPPSANP